MATSLDITRLCEAIQRTANDEIKKIVAKETEKAKEAIKIRITDFAVRIGINAQIQRSHVNLQDELKISVILKD